MNIEHLLKRIAAYVVTLFFCISINFFLPRMLPGDPITVFLEKMGQDCSYKGLDPAYLNEWRARFGLDKDLLTQYVMYLGNVFRLDIGFSMAFYPTPVFEIIARALPWSMALLAVTVTISWTVGTITGTFVAWKKGKTSDVLFYIMLGMQRIPSYIMAIILVYVFAYVLLLFPLKGGADLLMLSRTFNIQFILKVIHASILPALSIFLVNVGGWMLNMRSFVVNILGSDFLMLAKAKGLSEVHVRSKYVLRNAIIPQLTGLGMVLGFVITGSMIVEVIFSYPGLGYYTQLAIIYRDINLIQGIFLIVIFVVLTANLIVDLLHPRIDPRVSGED